MFDRIKKGLWWDRALTLIEGCSPVSPGCDNCWSAAMAHRFRKTAGELTPQVSLTNIGGGYNGNIDCRHDRLDLPQKVKKPTVWAVWNDLFHEDVPFVFQISTMVMIRDCPRHIFLILTKRPERAKYFFDLIYRGQFASQEPLFNVWLGVTAENQEQADKRIPILLQIPAAVRFVSVEPMIGPVDLASNRGLHIYWEGNEGKIKTYYGSTPFSFTERDRKGWVQYTGRGIDWIICGCESGPHRRPTEWPWIQSLQNQCEVAKVPFFLKQGELGGKVVKAPYTQHLELPNVR